MVREQRKTLARTRSKCIEEQHFFVKIKESAAYTNRHTPHTVTDNWEAKSIKLYRNTHSTLFGTDAVRRDDELLLFSRML